MFSVTCIEKKLSLNYATIHKTSCSCIEMSSIHVGSIVKVLRTYLDLRMKGMFYQFGDTHMYT